MPDNGRRKAVPTVKVNESQMRPGASAFHSWSSPEAPLCQLSPRRFEEHEDSRNRTLEIIKTVGFVELRALRVLRGENS